MTLPELVVEASWEVDATEDVYRIASYVGDDYEHLVIYIDGQVIALEVPATTPAPIIGRRHANLSTAGRLAISKFLSLRVLGWDNNQLRIVILDCPSSYKLEQRPA